MANEIVQSFSEQLSDKLISVENALPKDFNRERFVQNCLAVMNDNPQLVKMNRALVIQNVLKAAYIGLDFANKECYLIPYGNNIQFQTDYKGECKFVKRYAIRPIKDIYAKLVRKGDSFEEKVIDGQPSIDFKPVPFSDEEIVGAFAVVLYDDGGMEYEVMSTKEINEVRTGYSKMANGPSWKKSWGEMAKKTVLRRLCKHIETDFESNEARKAWEDGSDLDSNVINRVTPSEINANPFETEIVQECEVIEHTDDELPDFLKGEDDETDE